MTVDKSDNSSLSEVITVDHNIPIVYLPYLYLHYCVYLKVNYTNDADVAQLYQEYMASPMYMAMLDVKTVSQAQNLIKSKRDMQYDVIVAKRNEQFYTAWSLYPKSSWTWEPEINVVGAGLLDFQEFIEHIKDNNYVVSV
jgi:hypothetical protein